MIAPVIVHDLSAPRYESGRLLCTGQPGVTDYAIRALLVPYGRARGLALPLLRRLPAAVRQRAAKRLLRQDGGTPIDHRGSGRSAAVADQMAILAVALHEATTLLAGTPLEDWTGTHWVALRDYESEFPRGRLVLFLFRDGADAPAAVLKLRRTLRPGRSLAHEYDALRALRLLEQGVAASIPEPLAFRVHAGLEALLLSALPGATTDLLLHTPAYRRGHDHLTAGLEWLARFHRATRQPSACQPGAAARARALYRLQQHEAGANALRPLATTLRSGAELPLTMACGHGDFWPRNLIVREDRTGVGVVDWEHFRPAAPCVSDVFHFVITWALRSSDGTTVSGNDEAAAFAHAAGDRRRAAAIRDALGRYCHVSGVAPAELASGLPFCLLTRPLDQGGNDDDGWSDYAARIAAGEHPAFLP